MDFKEIKNINIKRNIPASSRKGEKKAEKNSCKNEKNIKKSPIDPNYWQNKTGVVQKNINFGSGNNSAGANENLEAQNYSQDFINPKTHLYDEKIKEKKEELDKKGMYPSLSGDIVKACIDMQTGEYSPIADDFLNFFLPLEEDSFKGKIMDFKARHNKKAMNLLFFKTTYPEYFLSELINSIKKEDGSFDKQNLILLKRLLKTENTDYDYSINSLALLFNTLKDDTGIVPVDKFKLAERIQRKTKSYSLTEEIYDKLNNFPKETRSMIFRTFYELKGDPNLKNFINNVNFAFTPQGNPIKENISLIKKLYSKFDNIETNESFYNMCMKSPDTKNFIYELANKTQKSNCLIKLEEIYNKYKQKDNNLSERIKTDIITYADCIGDIDLFCEIYDLCQSENNSTDRELFSKTLKFMQIINNIPNNTYIPELSGKQYIDIINQNLKLSDINFRDKINLIETLKAANTYIQNNNIKGFEFLEQTITDIDSGLNFEDISINIDENTKKNFIKNVLKTKNNSLTEFEKTITESIPLLKNMSNGINLVYSRKEFLNDLSFICTDKETKEIIENKTGISLITEEKDNETIITGYNGIIKLNELNKNNSTEKQIYDIMHRFICENEVQTENKDLNKQLNYIIKAFPEFINIIGKKQHATHNYTLDVHSLLVLANTINNPDYITKLNETDKVLIKIAAILHDISKKENKIDKGHQNQSSLYSRSIIKKLFKNPEQRDRLYEIIQNHHWLEEYSNTTDKDKISKELAFRFRRPNDFEIAKILAKSDLEAVSDNFYNMHKHKLDEPNLEAVENNLKYLYSTGNAIFTDYFISDKVSDNNKTIKDGKEYTVIDFHNIDTNEDLGKYGFANGLTKENAVFLVHMVDNSRLYNSLKTTKLLTSPYNGGVLSESIITPQYKRTYARRKYGFLLSQINTNIINEEKTNQSSGIQKGIENVLKLIYTNTKSRLNFKKTLLYNLGIDETEIKEDDFSEFYKNTIASKTSLNQINPNKEYKIGRYGFSGTELINAIKEYQESLIDKEEHTHNEIIGYTPKIQGLIAIADTINELPDDFLKFAYENNYPIILI